MDAILDFSGTLVNRQGEKYSAWATVGHLHPAAKSPATAERL
jgi:hypothetical protein